MGLARSVDPSEEPLTLAEVKQQRRITGTNDDEYLNLLIQAAREFVESFTGRALVTQTWAWTFDGFPLASGFECPRAPLAGVDKIEYVDTAGVTQTLDAGRYTVTQPLGERAQPGRVDLAYGESWPATRSQVNAVTVTFTAGYGGASSVPASLKAAMLLLIGNWEVNREAVLSGTIATEVPLSVKALLSPFRILRVP